jgi:RHS repeat-associated protein
MVLRDSISSGGGNYGLTGSGLDQRLYPVVDANWNTTGLVKPGGIVAQDFLYDPYGNATPVNANATASVTDGYDWMYLHQGGRLDSVTGLYDFRHRDYSVTLGRWGEADSSYGDGLDLYQFGDSEPVGETDSSGAASGTTNPTQPSSDLTFTPVDGPMGGDCGSFLWKIKWSLISPSRQGGWIVQHVVAKVDATDCKGSKINYNTSGWPLWEAWPVHQSNKITDLNVNGASYDDNFEFGFDPNNPNPPLGVCTKGTITITGDAEYYDGLTLPSTFVSGGAKNAGSLKSTQIDPGQLPGGTGSITRRLTATWNCCPNTIRKGQVSTN